EARTLKEQTRHLPSLAPQDPEYRRLRYVRYADDFLLGFIGPRTEAEEIKEQLTVFLHDELKLELSKAKTLITHARTQAARFLGYEVTTIQDDAKRSRFKRVMRRSVNGQVGLRVPLDVLQEKCNRYKRRGKATHRMELTNESDYTILATYQLEYRGIVNYYRLAYNLHTLQHLKWVMDTSLTKTLAHKHKLSVPKVYDKYRAELNVNGVKYKGLQVVVPREGKNPLIATWGGIPLTWDVKATLEDQPHQQAWGKRSELEKRLLAQVCEQCGTTALTDKIEVHVRRFGGRDRAHQTVRELMEGSLYTPLTHPSKEDGDQSMWGRPCREKSLIF
ncbi:MAG TPA: group II intron reverse transcriptase/maturase, partial [Ktedonobacteraceae bacterium]|nr:group II intron reverse transcriptase/maturase [Ktedonobacteraceae bacterium]